MRSATPDSVSGQAGRDEFLTELNRILSSELFVRSGRLCRFLRFVVERTLDGEAAQIKEYSIGVEVFGKGPDFDPRLDSAVRVDARRLRAKLAEYYAGIGAGNPARIILPKGAYVPEFIAANPAVPSTTVEPAPPPRRNVCVAGALGALLAVVAFAGVSVARERSHRPAPRTVPDPAFEGTVSHASLLSQRRTEKSLERAIEYLSETLRDQPEYAPAQIALADANLSLADYRGIPERTILIARARAHAERAIQLRPADARPVTTLAAMQLDYERDWRGAEALFLRSLSLDPEYWGAHSRYSRLLYLEGRFPEALEQARRAERLAPLSLGAKSAVAQVCFYSRRYDDALAVLEQALEIDPGFENGRLARARSRGMLRQFAAAGIEIESVAGPEAAAIRVWLLGLEGRTAEAREWLSKTTGASAVSLAAAYGSLGDKNGAFDALGKAAREHDPSVVYVRASPILDGLRSDPRFHALCREIGLPE